MWFCDTVDKPSNGLISYKHLKMEAGSLTIGQTVSFNVENQSPVAVLHLQGQLVQLEVYKFKVQVEKLIADEYRFLVFDLAQLTFIDSAGIGAMMQIRSELIKFGGALVLAAPNSIYVSNALRSSQLGKIIPCFATLPQAQQFLGEKFGLKPMVPADDLAEKAALDVLHLILDRLGSIEGRLERMENR